MDIQAHTVEAATSGDAEAVRQLIDALHGPLYNLALRMLGQHQDAEDATQEALLRVVTHLGSFRGESRFSTWAWTIATRVVLEFRKRRASVPIPIEAFEADLADGRDDDARIENTVLLTQVKLGCGRAMLQVLDDDLRVAYVLGEILEVPGPEAAAAVGISAAAFRKRLSRARTLVHANLNRVCGVVNEASPCRCRKRVRPAQRLGRLDPKDAEAPLDLAALERAIGQLHDLQRATAYYRADPAARSTTLVAKVKQALQI